MSDKIMPSITSTVRDTKKNRSSSLDKNRDAIQIFELLLAENFKPNEKKESINGVSACLGLLLNTSD